MVEDEGQDELFDEAEQSEIFVAANLVEDSGLLFVDEGAGRGAGEILGHEAVAEIELRAGRQHILDRPARARGNGENVLEVEIVVHGFPSPDDGVPRRQLRRFPPGCRSSAGWRASQARRSELPNCSPVRPQGPAQAGGGFSSWLSSSHFSNCRQNARRSVAYDRGPFQADAAARGKVFQLLQGGGARPGFGQGRQS